MIGRKKPPLPKAPIPLPPSPVSRPWARWYGKVKEFRDSYGDRSQRVIECEPSDSEANLVLSKIKDEHGFHAPVIDIDLPCELIPSKTPGHYHLYIDKPIAADKYFAMLKAMADAGIVEQGYYIMSKRKGFSAVRVPPITKAEIKQATDELQAMINDLRNPKN